MMTLGILLQQIKEKEEHDLAYAKKIKEVETLLKAEQDALKKLKFQKKKLSEEIKIKRLRCSAKEITKVGLQHQKQIWEDLLQEVQKDLTEKETKLDELQQSVCLNRLAFCSDIKVFLVKNEVINASNSYSINSSLPALTDTKIKIEQEEDDYANHMEEIMSLQNQLEELKAEEIQIEEAKRLKVQLEAEPSCGEEFLRNQKLLKETTDSLKNAEEEVRSLKIEISEKELILLTRKSPVTEVKADGSQILQEKPIVFSQPIKTVDAEKSSAAQGNIKASKTVTFNNTVEMKTISLPIQNKIVLKSKNKTKSPSPALRKKLSQQLSSKLDETMRDILFKDKI